jgi:hypothetical protein
MTELAAHPNIRATSFNDRRRFSSATARRRRSSSTSAEPLGRMMDALHEGYPSDPGRHAIGVFYAPGRSSEWSALRLTF